MSDRSTPSGLQIGVAFAILYIVWGTTYLAIQIGVLNEQMPPLLFAGSRIATAGVILLAFQLLRGQPLRIQRNDVAGIAVGSMILFVIGNGLISIALKTVASGESAVLAATTTLWVAAVGLVLPGGDRLRPAGWLGLFTGMLGVVVIKSPALREQGFSFAYNIGPWLVLCSAAAWGIGTVLLRKATVQLPRLSSVGWQMAIGGGVMVAIGFLVGEKIPERITLGTIGAFLYLLVFGSLTAFVAFNWLLEHVSAPKVTTYAYVNPLVAVLLGTWLHDEPMTMSLVLGMLLIFAALFLVRHGTESKREMIVAEPDA